jgi:hypothetical protein
MCRLTDFSLIRNRIAASTMVYANGAGLFSKALLSFVSSVKVGFSILSWSGFFHFSSRRITVVSVVFLLWCPCNMQFPLSKLGQPPLPSYLWDI